MSPISEATVLGVEPSRALPGDVGPLARELQRAVVDPRHQIIQQAGVMLVSPFDTPCGGKSSTDSPNSKRTSAASDVVLRSKTPTGCTGNLRLPVHPLRDPLLHRHCRRRPPAVLIHMHPRAARRTSPSARLFPLNAWPKPSPAPTPETRRQTINVQLATQTNTKKHKVDGIGAT